MNKLFWILPFLTLASLGAGCGQTGQTQINSTSTDQMTTVSTTASQDQPALNSCNWLTKTLAEQVLGGAVEGPSSRNVSNVVSTCTYGTVGTPMKSLTLLVRRAATRQESEQIFKQAKDESKAMSGAEPVQVKNLGDEAYWTGGSLNQLNVRKGDDWLIVNFFGSDKGKELDKSKEAMQLLLKNI